VLACPRCGLRPANGPPRAKPRGGGRLRLVAVIEDVTIIGRILEQTETDVGSTSPLGGIFQ
jgi:hypothetical protein